MTQNQPLMAVTYREIAIPSKETMTLHNPIPTSACRLFQNQQSSKVSQTPNILVNPTSTLNCGIASWHEFSHLTTIGMSVNFLVSERLIKYLPRRSRSSMFCSRLIFPVANNSYGQSCVLKRPESPEHPKNTNVI